MKKAFMVFGVFAGMIFSFLAGYRFREFVMPVGPMCDMCLQHGIMDGISFESRRRADDEIRMYQFKNSFGIHVSGCK